jgi:glycosyltransferase involved in cell wall biosynthesis
MRLGFHYHIAAIKKSDLILMPGYLGRFLDSLAAECEFITCFMHSPLGAEIDRMDYALKSKNVQLINIVPHASIPKRMLRAGQVKKIIRENCGNLDLFLIRGPSPLLPAIADACQPFPTALLLVGDYLAGIDSLPQPTWRKELIRIWSRWNAKRQLKIAKRSLTFVNSHLLFQQFQEKIPTLIETRTTTLSLSDFYTREDTCQGRPIRLLYTGRIDRAKGLLDILDALQILTAQGEEVIFDLVGMLEKGDPILDEVLVKADLIGLSNRVNYHGYRPLGPELFHFYKQADIYIIASQSSEGFPRTIWEAMAHSLPVIATKVGSIPDFIGNSAFLVAPNQPDQLSEGIMEIIKNKELRIGNIKKGYALAQTNTLEIRAKQMITEMENYLRRIKK